MIIFEKPVRTVRLELHCSVCQAEMRASETFGTSSGAKWKHVCTKDESHPTVVTDKAYPCYEFRDLQ